VRGYGLSLADHFLYAEPDIREAGSEERDPLLELLAAASEASLVGIAVGGDGSVEDVAGAVDLVDDCQLALVEDLVKVTLKQSLVLFD